MTRKLHHLQPLLVVAITFTVAYMAWAMAAVRSIDPFSPENERWQIVLVSPGLDSFPEFRQPFPRRHP